MKWVRGRKCIREGVFIETDLEARQMQSMVENVSGVSQTVASKL